MGVVHESPAQTRTRKGIECVYFWFSSINVVFMHMLAGRGVFSCLSVYMATYVLIFLFRFECQEAQIPICTTAIKHVNL